MTDEIDLPLSELDLHPENMRGRYDDIDELKNSLEVEGQREALLVVPAPGGGYWVVNGNRRLLALRKLGAPTARCHVVEMSRRDQLIHMGITALSRRDVDPISEARHYNRLIEGEGETQVSLARALGINASRIGNRLRLLDLDAPIQDLIAAGRLSHDPRLCAGLLEVPDTAQRIALAEALAGKKLTLASSINACRRLKERLAEQQAEDEVEQAVTFRKRRHGPRHFDPRKLAAADASVASDNGLLAQASPAREPHQPAVALGVHRSAKPEPPATATLALDVIRAQARATCEKCDQYARANAAEPAWATVAHAADVTCEACGLQDLRGACTACPLPGMIRRIVTYTRLGVNA